jgi:hypothetical protein
LRGRHGDEGISECPIAGVLDCPPSSAVFLFVHPQAVEIVAALTILTVQSKITAVPLGEH